MNNFYRGNIIKTAYSAVFIALGIVLPFAFHAIPNAGSILLPMHIPVLLCGLICGAPYGLACGILTPLISSALTGMPNAAVLPAMICELAAYGLASGLLIRFIKTKSFYSNIYISLIGAMLFGRIFYGLINAIIFKAGQYSIGIWASAAFITAIPGAIIQIIIIPIIIISLKQANLIPLNEANTSRVKNSHID